METILRKFIKTSLLCSLVAGLILADASFITPAAFAAESITTWWPTSGAHVSGTQPFKAMIPGLDISQYEMFWQVDGGTWNWMDNSYTDYPHKEAQVDLSGWSWQKSGSYTVTFIARQNGAILGQTSVTIYVDNGGAVSAVSAPTTTTSVPTATAAPTTTTTSAPTVSATPATAPSISIASVPVSSGNPLSGSTFYVDSNSSAAHQAAVWQYSDPIGARAMQTLASAATASWFGEWNSNVAQDVRSLVSRAQSAGSVPVLVAYAIPQRDCGGYSSGGTNNPSAYSSWIQNFASGIGSAKAVVILEPDALAQTGCLSSSDKDTRLALIAGAVSTLKHNANTKVYIDAGHSGWIDTTTMANALNRANIAAADGFSLNVSNFVATSNEVTYGSSLSSALSGKHFVVDTSRNGNGSSGEWCNPSGRAIGALPTVATGNSLVDAYLWLKVPGESDGSCNGGPSAGTWWPDYAKALVQNAH